MSIGFGPRAPGCEKQFAEHPERDTIVSRLREWGIRHPEVRRIIVFGSRARGEHHAGSDLDLALELSKSRWDESPEVIWMSSAGRWRQELAPSIPWSLDLQWHDLDGATPIVSSGINRGHFVVYNADASDCPPAAPSS